MKKAAGTFSGCLGLLLFYAAYLGAAAIHLFTVYIAFTLKGLIAAFITFLFPFLSQIFWNVVMWKRVGVFNWLTMGCVVVILSYGLAYAFIAAGAKAVEETE